MLTVIGEGLVDVVQRASGIEAHVGGSPLNVAVGLARPGDILLLAGKGHEDYQIIGTVKYHFDDREEAAAAFTENMT